MKRRILLIILTILLTITTIITYLKFNYKPINTKQDKVIEFEIKSIENIELCKNKNKCDKTEDIYLQLKYEFDNNEMQQWITKTNKKTEQDYQEAINSNVLDETCINVKDIYNHKYNNKIYYNNYNGDKHISLSVKRLKKNLCTNETKELPTETFIYSKEKQRQITQEELKEELNITDNIIKESIKKHIENINTSHNTNIPIEIYQNYNLYYDLTGSLLIEFYQESEQSYYSAVILN